MVSSDISSRYVLAAVMCALTVLAARGTHLDAVPTVLRPSQRFHPLGIACLVRASLCLVPVSGTSCLSSLSGFPCLVAVWPQARRWPMTGGVRRTDRRVLARRSIR